MHKKTSFLLTLFGLFFLFNLFPVKAQTKMVSVWNCLPARKDGINKIRLFQKGLAEKDQVYVVDCIGTPAGSYCTTGNKDNDEKLKIGLGEIEVPFVLDNPTSLKDKKASEFAVTVNFAKTPLHSFYYVYFDRVDDSAKTIKYGSINFSGNSCANTVMAVPDYRFFDIGSLEPIPDVRITLTDENGTAMVPSQVTRADGAYYYPHEDRNLKFKLEIDGDKYSYPNQVSQGTIKNYKSNFDNYIKKTYTDTDVPLVPKQGGLFGMGSLGSRTEAPVGVFYSVDKFERFTRVQGRVSIPHSVVAFSQGELEIQRIKSDKFGDYSVNIDNNKINLEQGLQISYIKANLLSSDVDNVQGIAINLGEEIVPISPEIEGYAIDSAGNIIPEGIIEVVLKASDKPYYTTKANKDGYFKLNADELPKFEYTLYIYASEASINLYNYSEKSVQDQLVAKMQTSTASSVELAIGKELVDRTTYLEPAANIFKTDDPTTIAKKQEVVANQKAVSAYMIRSIINDGEVGKLFGTDINQISKADFEAKLQKDLTVIFENRDSKFATEFSQYFTDLSYSQELIGYVSGNNVDMFTDKMADHFVNEIFEGNKLLSLNTTNIKSSKGTRVLAATTSQIKFDAKYFEKKVNTAVSNVLSKIVTSNRNVDLGKALAREGKTLAVQIIGDEISNVVGKNNPASKLLTTAIGAIINGRDVGKAITNTARSMLINQGEKLLTEVLTNPKFDAAGKLIPNSNRFLPGEVAAPIVGFLMTAIRTGDVGQAFKSGVMTYIQNGVTNLIKDFIGNIFGTTFGSFNVFWGALASIGVGLIVGLLMKLLSGSS